MYSTRNILSLFPKRSFFQKIMVLLGLISQILFLTGCTRKEIVQDARLEEFTSYLDNRIPELMNNYNIPGVTIALVKEGRVHWTNAYGYAWLHREELSLSSAKNNEYLELGRLLAFRDQLVRDRTGLMNSLKELKNLLSSPSTDVCCKSLHRSIMYIIKQILMLENRMKTIIKSKKSLDINFT